VSVAFARWVSVDEELPRDDYPVMVRIVGMSSTHRPILACRSGDVWFYLEWPGPIHRRVDMWLDDAVPIYRDPILDWLFTLWDREDTHGDDIRDYVERRRTELEHEGKHKLASYRSGRV